MLFTSCGFLPFLAFFAFTWEFPKPADQDIFTRGKLSFNVNDRFNKPSIMIVWESNSSPTALICPLSSRSHLFPLPTQLDMVLRNMVMSHISPFQPVTTSSSPH